MKGSHKVNLSWNGATNVDVFRDGLLQTTIANGTFYTDNINNKGGGSYTHKVCDASTGTCSNVTTTVF